MEEEERVYELIHIPLAKAALCINCENIGTNMTYCSACSSNNVIPLEKFFNREIK